MITIFSITSACSLLLFVFYLIYKGKLKEQYAILWIVLSIVILAFSIYRNGLDTLAKIFGVYYAPSLLFIFAFFIMILVLIQMSVVISSLKDSVKTLSQEIGLLKNEQQINKN